MSVPSSHEFVPLVPARASSGLAAEVITSCVLVTTSAAKPVELGSKRRRAGVWGGCVLLPNGEGCGRGLCPLPRFFLFSNSKGLDLLHSAWVLFYSSAACFTRKITELLSVLRHRLVNLVYLKSHRL